MWGHIGGQWKCWKLYWINKFAHWVKILSVISVLFQEHKNKILIAFETMQIKKKDIYN